MGDGPTDRVRACLPHGVGGHRVEADGCALSQWAVDGVAQVENDSIGIVVAGKGVDGLGYILADRTCKLSPDGWGRRAVEAYREFKADRIIAERNFSGAMVRHVIKTVEKSVSYKEVTASRGKIARAEPVAALYEQGRVKHAGSFPELEDEMCAMAPEGYVGDGSPDRADAAIWALTELMIQPFEPAQAVSGSYGLFLDAAPSRLAREAAGLSARCTIL